MKKQTEMEKYLLEEEKKSKEYVIGKVVLKKNSKDVSF